MAATKVERLSIRLSTQADALIKDAAETLGTSVNDYVTQSAVDRAHQVLADQHHFTLDSDKWERFIEALDRPAKANDRLAEFLRRPSLLDG
jgi:uncharacterized protein (DUF1778 family)